MTTTVTGKNQITIPASLAVAHRLKPGSRIEWLPGDAPDEIRCRIIPDPATLAAELRGAGRRHLRRGRRHPLKALQAERAEGDANRDRSL